MCDAQNKTCSVCHQSKARTEYYRDKRSLDGLQSRCGDCARAANKAWRESRPDYFKNLYLENRDDYLAASKENRKANPGRQSAYAKAWREANLERERRNKKIYRQNNREHIHAKVKEWQAANPERHRAIIRSSTARRRAMKAGGMTGPEMSDWLKSAPRKCYWCQCKLTDATITVDHYVALSRGGAHVASNLVPACKPCNSSKHNKDPFEFAQTRGMLL